MGSHLSSKLLPIMADTPFVRIDHIHREQWIRYPVADQILLKMEDLYVLKEQRRPIGMLLVGPTNNGKTMILDKFRRKYPTVDDPLKNTLECPCLYVVAPAKPDLSAFHYALLIALKAQFKGSEPSHWRERQVKRLMRETKVRMLFVDEFQHVGNGGHAHTTQLLNGIKNLTTELKIPLVCAGTQSAFNVVRSDPQIENRIHPYPLPYWKNGDALRRLLVTMEQNLPLKKPSNLASDEMMHLILSMCDGDKNTPSYGATVGEITMLIKAAAVTAIRTGAEQITEAALRKSGYQSPSKRRESAERVL